MGEANFYYFTCLKSRFRFFYRFPGTLAFLRETLRTDKESARYWVITGEVVAESRRDRLETDR